MDNKGFTLVELLATVVILGLVMGITVSGVGSVINNSKRKSEEMFVGKLNDAIEEYIDLKGMTLSVKGEVKAKFIDSFGNVMTQKNELDEDVQVDKFIKRSVSECFADSQLTSKVEVYNESTNVWKEKCYDKNGEVILKPFYNDVSLVELESISILDLVDERLLDGERLINPSNKLKCFSNTVNPSIKIFKDSDYVYYYYVDLSDSNNSCELNEELAIINTIPSSMWINFSCSDINEDLKQFKNKLIVDNNLNSDLASKIRCT